MFAFILGAAAAARAESTTTEAKEEWAHLYLKVPDKCIPVLGADRSKEAINIREGLTTARVSVRLID